jgi:hypothetical protein
MSSQRRLKIATKCSGRQLSEEEEQKELELLDRIQRGEIGDSEEEDLVVLDSDSEEEESDAGLGPDTYVDDTELADDAELSDDERIIRP